MRLVWSGLVVLLVVLLIPSSLAATISGTLYDYSLEELPDVIVTIDSIPPQKYIVKDGSYHFTIGFGIYKLEAKHYEDNILKESALEEIVIDKEGDYIVDLILLPSLDEEQKLIQDFPVNFDPYEEKKTPVKILFALVSFLLLVVIIYYIKRAERDIEAEKQAPTEEIEEKIQEQKTHSEKNKKIEKEADYEPEGDKYFQQILVMIKEHKRITQKEIRKDIPLSEAKVSLIITEMESKGLVQKIKKGRGNIIVWK